MKYNSMECNCNFFCRHIFLCFTLVLAHKVAYKIITHKIKQFPFITALKYS